MNSSTTLKILLLSGLLILFTQPVSAQQYKERLDSLLLYTEGLASIRPEESVNESRLIQKLALEAEDSLRYAEALFIEGKAHYNIYEFDQAAQLFQETYNIYKKLNDSTGQAKADIFTGLIELRAGDFYPALAKFERALSISQKARLQERIVQAYFYIARVHLAKNDIDAAFPAARKAQEAVKNLKDLNPKGEVYTLMAEIYLSKAELKKAGDYLSNALVIFQNEGNRQGIAKVHTIRARVEAQKENYKQAILLIRDAIAQYKLLGSVYEEAETELIHSSFLIDSGNVQAGLKAVHRADTLVKKLPVSHNLNRDIAKNLAHAYLAGGDSARALEHYIRFKELDDLSKTENLKELTLQREFKQQKTANEQLYNINARKDDMLQRSKNLMLILSGLIVVCAMLIFALTRNIAKKKNFSRRLVEKNELIVEKQKQLDEQQKELKESNKKLLELDKTKNKLFSVITHDLRQPISQVKSVLTLLEMDELNDKERKDIIDKVKQSIDNSSNALENLLLWSKKQLTGINTTIVDVHLLPQLLQLESHLAANLKAKDLSLKLNVPDFFKVKADMNQLDICLRNLLTNAIKFSNKSGTITIDAIESNGDKIVRVIDQGVGMTQNQVDQLNSLSGQLSTLGTMNEKGTGLGVLITKEFMENQNGELRISSRPGEGSIFSLVFHNNTKVNRGKRATNEA